MRNLDVNSKIIFGLLYEISTIASVSIDASYPWKSYDKHCHKSVSGFGIVNIGRGCGRLQNVTVLISYYVAFYALYLLIPSNPFWERGRAERELSLSMAPMVGCGDSPLLSLTFSTRLSSSSEKASIAPQRLK